MPDITTFFKSNYLRAIDEDLPATLTIKSAGYEEVGQDKEEKWVIYFNEDPRGVIMGPVVFEQISALAETNDVDEMVDLEVELFRDPTVTYAGKRCGGVRLREPSKGKKK